MAVIAASGSNAPPASEAQVVVDRGPGFLPFLPRFFTKTLHQASSDAIVHAVRFDGVAGVVGEGPTSELGIIAVRVEQRVRAIRRHLLGLRNRGRQPPVVRLTGKLQHPARHRDGIPSLASSLASG